MIAPQRHNFIDLASPGHNDVRFPCFNRHVKVAYDSFSENIHKLPVEDMESFQL